MSSSSYQASINTESTPSELIEHLVQFDGAPEQFLTQLLAVQCRVGQAESGAILRTGAQGQPEVLAINPPLAEGQTAPVWLAQAAEMTGQVLKSRESHAVGLYAPDELYGVDPSQYLVMMPILGGTQVRGVSAFLINEHDPGVIDQCRQRLELTIALLSLYEMRLTLQRRQGNLERLRQACEVLAELNTQSRYKAAAMSICNQVATAWDADRVSFGVLKGRYVKLQAMSHTEKFTRKMELVQYIESAMEECLDQEVEVLHPSDPTSTFVSRSAAELATRFGPSVVLSMPLRQDHEPVGVLTVEWPPTHRPLLEEVESLRLACDMVTTRLVDLEEHDKWIGARAWKRTRDAAAVLLGPEHTWMKIAAIAVVGLILFMTFARGTYRVEAPFVVEATTRQLIVAPYDGYLKESFVRPGDSVVAGETVLATLHTDLLQQQLAELRAEKLGHLKTADVARREDRIADAQIAMADADSVQARMDILQWQVDKATIVSPITGRVITGDLEKQHGGPVSRGQTMFEVAPLQAMRVELAVPEDLVADLGPGQQGELSAVSHPGEKLKFSVERVDPVAEVIENRNVFTVRGRLIGPPPSWMRIGMEGAGKVDVDQRSYAEIWTRDLVNWIRMKLWI